MVIAGTWDARNRDHSEDTALGMNEVSSMTMVLCDWGKVWNSSSGDTVTGGIGGPEPEGACQKGGREEAEPDGTRAKELGFIYLRMRCACTHMHMEAQGLEARQSPYGCTSHHSHGKQEGRRAVGFLVLIRNFYILVDTMKSTKWPGRKEKWMGKASADFKKRKVVIDMTWRAV